MPCAQRCWCRLMTCSRKRTTTGEHEFARICAVLKIDYRLIPPKSPQTNSRTFQQSHRGSAPKPPFPIRQSIEDDAPSLYPALQPATPATSLGQQKRRCRRWRAGTTQTGLVQKAAILHLWMWQLCILPTKLIASLQDPKVGPVIHLSSPKTFST